MLTQERLRELLYYDPETGEFTRLSNAKRSDWVGHTAGYYDKRGRLHISICNVDHYAHRLAWLYMTGRQPQGGIDHIDGNPRNNRWANLRLADQSQNLANSCKRRSGLKGVIFDKNTKRYGAKITVNYKRIALGHYATEAEAHAAYCEAARKYFGEFARTK